MAKEKKKYEYFTKAVRCPDGSRKYIRAKTKKELEEKVKAAELELAGGININDNTTFGQLAQVWIDLYKRPHNKPQSLQPVLNRLNHYLMPRLAEMRVRDIKPVHIAQAMLDAANLCRVNQSSLISEMRAIFNLAVDNQLIARSPVPSTLKPSAPVSEDREPLTPEQCSALLEEVKNLPRASWVYDFIMIGLFTGMRAGEICGLCWDCVNFETNTITVKRQVVCPGGAPQLTDVLKTANSTREIPAPPELMAHLRQLHAKTRTIYVVASTVGTLISPPRASDVVAMYGEKIGLHVHPHLLRHTYATRLVESGLDIKEVQYLLGHSTPAMTLRIYAHYDQKSRAEITAKKVSAVSFTTQPVANLLQIRSS